VPGRFALSKTSKTLLRPRDLGLDLAKHPRQPLRVLMALLQHPCGGIAKDANGG
jgi:hypothetical protein